MKKQILIFSLIVTLTGGCIKESYLVGSNPFSTTLELNSVQNIFPTDDNGLLISGPASGKYTLLKTRSYLNIEWIRNNFDWGTLKAGSGWGSSFYSVSIVRVLQLEGGEYVCFGSIAEGGDVVYSSAIVIVLSPAGEEIQKYMFNDVSISNALQTDDGYLLFGTSLLKLDKNFKLVWSRQLYNGTQMSVQITKTSDGGFAFTGSYNGEQIFLKKFDSAGNEILNRTYKHNEFPFEEAGYDLIQVQDNGFLITGRAGRTDALNIVDCQIMRTNEAGDTLWTRRFGYDKSSWLNKIVSASNGVFVIEGTIGYPNENPKSLLLRIDLNGHIIDSITTKKIQFLAPAPNNRYILAQGRDSAHVDFKITDSDGLFKK